MPNSEVFIFIIRGKGFTTKYSLIDRTEFSDKIKTFFYNN